jgi:diaminopimelate epimerase
MEIPFTKMHGLGNCFILMDDRDDRVGAIHESPLRLAKAVCDRNFGIGADGLILVCNSSVWAHGRAPIRMRIFNKDGSEPEMCGNGIRCFARYLVDEGIIDGGAVSNDRAKHASPLLQIETMAGIMQTRLLDDGHVEVDIGEPLLNTDDVISDGDSPIIIDEHGYKFTFVSMGNPHAVAFVDEINFDWTSIGAKVECSRYFPNRTNVEFVQILSPKEAAVKVWERGCGETMACGTGACAVTVAGALHGLFPREPIAIHLPGGTLKIHWAETYHVMMTGPAVTVCKGVYMFS